MELGPLPNWSLDEYHRECAGLVEVKRFDDVAADGCDLVVNGRNRFE